MATALPLPASKVTVPVSRSVPSDTDIFRSIDGATGFYVPRYRIQETQGPNGLAYAMAFIQDTNGRWGLQVTLESAPPSGGASRYKIADHDLQMTLSFHPGGDPTRNRKLLQFQDRVVRAKTAQMTLWIDSLPERDEVYHAISNAAYRAKVTLQRRTQLAVENTQEVAESFQESALENNNLFLSGIDLSKSLVRTDMSRFMVKAQRTKFPKPKLNVLEVGQARDKKGRYIAAYLSVENWPRFGKQLFEFIEFKDGNRKRKGSRLNIMVVDADRGNTLQSFANFEDPEQLSKMLVRLDCIGSTSKPFWPPIHSCLIPTCMPTSLRPSPVHHRNPPQKDLCGTVRSSTAQFIPIFRTTSHSTGSTICRTTSASHDTPVRSARRW